MIFKSPNSNFTSKEETKNFVTPFAFGVHDSLLGMRLATPRRRLGAILVDLICIGLLTLLPSFWLSSIILIVVVWSLYELRNQERRTGIKIGLVFIGFITALMMITQLTWNSVMGDDEPEASDNIFGISLNFKADKDSSALTYLNEKVSEDYRLVINDLKGLDGKTACESGDECDERFFEALSSDLLDKDYEVGDARKIYLGVRDFLQENNRLDDSFEDSTLTSSLYQTQASSRDLTVDNGTKSVVAWVEGALGDLGLSFGWAAVYFSLLTVWGKGQTLGKRLFGIKVVRIDGGMITLWESIGRYGGYSAGIGTGLLGFLQIYWDANRQGIQDKISETLVVQL